MGTLDIITQLKDQGFQEDQIIEKLKENGISPQEITSGLEQSKIKSAVNAEQQTMETSIPEKQTSPIEETQMPPLEEPIKDQIPQEPGGYIQPNYQETSPENYSQQEYDYPQPDSIPQQGYLGTSTETMIEIAEQVFTEKIKKLEKESDEFKEFQTIAKSKIEDLEIRLKRIEETLDKLQNAILEKVGTYGAGISGIKKEMSMMQDSFNKLVNHKIKSPSNLKKSKK